MKKEQYYYHCLPVEKKDFAVMVEIPSYLQAETAYADGKATPLDTFVSNHEPVGIEEEEKFKSNLQSMLDYIFYLGGAPTPPTLRGSLRSGDKSSDV